MLSTKDLTFCREYVRLGDGAAAFSKAYGVPKVWRKQSRRDAAYLMMRIEIREEIRRQRDKQAVKFLNANELKTRWTRIALADPRELIALHVGCCRYCHGVGFGYQWKEREFMEACEEVERYNVTASKPEYQKAMPDIAGGLGYNHTLEPHPDCPECGGEGLERVVPIDTRRIGDDAALLYAGVKQTRNGLEISLVDRLKALEALSKMEGLFTDTVKLSGSLDLTNRTVQITTDDPQKAAEIYQDMIAGGE